MIVSVSGAEDGLPRSGLAPTNYDVVSVVSGEDTGPRQQLIAQVVEGPAEIYQLVLDGDGRAATLVPRRSMLAITVQGDTRRVAGRTIGDRRSWSAAHYSPRRHERRPYRREVICVPAGAQRSSSCEQTPRRSGANKRPSVTGMRPAT